MSEHGPDLHVLARSLVQTRIRLESTQPAILSVRPPISVTKKTQICPILPQTFMGIIRGPVLCFRPPTAAESNKYLMKIGLL